MKTALVTGTTGFLGTNLVHELVKQGWKVRATGRREAGTKYIADLPIEIILADLTNPEEVDPLVEGCDVVFNVAGDTSFWKKRYARQRAINVDAPVHIANACLKHGVKRLVHTSTLDVLGYNPTGGSFDETTGHFNFDGIGYNYGETKLEGEHRLRAMMNDDLEIVFIYPGFLVGPYDHTLQLGRVFFDLKNGTLPAIPCGGGSYCHVTEVAKAHIAAATKGRPGEGYLCAGMPHSNITHRDMFERMAKAVNGKAPGITPPRWGLRAYGWVSEFLANFTGKEPDMNPGMAYYLSCPQYALSGKAVRELDYKIPSIEDCINDALAWYRDNGYDI